MHPPPSYARDIERMRREKSDFFRMSPESPLDPSDRALALRFFAVDPAYRVEAAWEPAAPPLRRIRLGTSTGEEREYLDAGALRFRIDGQERTLRGFISAGRAHELFVPFRDATSGKESYGASRYLEVPLPAHGEAAILDLNLAYNPWCAYSDAYSCPLPPRENWLDIPIRAGEMAFKD